MFQRLLTKYGVVFHAAVVCLLAASCFYRHSAYGVTAILWISWLAVIWALMVPAVRRGETLVDARKRVTQKIVWDPLLYFGIAILLLVGIQVLNSGCTLEYLPDADVWRFSDPPVPWLPFSVERAASYKQLIVCIALMVLALTLRSAVGMGGKRVFLQLVGGGTGLIGLFVVGMLLFGSPACLALVAGRSTSGVGAFHAFWALVSMGVWAEALPRRQRRLWLLVLFGIIGNMAGMLFLATPLTTMIFLAGSLLQLLFILFYLPQRVSGGRVLLVVVGAVVLAASVIGVAMFHVDHQVGKKLATVMELHEYWDSLVSQNEKRFEVAVKIWQEHIWQGVGHDGFKHFAGIVYDANAWKMLGGNRSSVNNDSMQFLCEYGLIGSVLLVGSVIVLLASVGVRARNLRLNQMEDKRKGNWFILLLSPIAVAGALSLILCSLVSMVESPFRSPAVLLSWVAVLTILPTFIPETINE